MLDIEPKLTIQVINRRGPVSEELVGEGGVDLLEALAPASKLSNKDAPGKRRAVDGTISAYATLTSKVRVASSRREKRCIRVHKIDASSKEYGSRFERERLRRRNQLQALIRFPTVHIV